MHIEPQRTRWLRWFLGCWLLVAAAGIVPVTATPAYAQDSEKTEEPVSTDMFTHIIKSAGIFFGPMLLLVSIGLVTLIVLLAMDLRMGNSIPPAFVDDFAETVNKRQFKQAFDLCKSDGSFLARVLTAGMGRLQYGIEDAREAAFNMVDSVRSGKEQLINYLGTIGTLGPMIGLVGTVYGMIQSFMELSKGGTPKSEDLAKGISHALVVTLLGVAISVPAIFFYTFFRNRLVRMTMDTSNLADDLLTQMYHNSKKAAAAEAVPTAVRPK
jgi:biopolymer transport protein ExbB